MPEDGSYDAPVSHENDRLACMTLAHLFKKGHNPRLNLESAFPFRNCRAWRGLFSRCEVIGKAFACFRNSQPLEEAGMTFAQPQIQHGALAASLGNGFCCAGRAAKIAGVDSVDIVLSQSGSDSGHLGHATLRERTIQMPHVSLLGIGFRLAVANEDEGNAVTVCSG